MNKIITIKYYKKYKYIQTIYIYNGHRKTIKIAR